MGNEADRLNRLRTEGGYYLLRDRARLKITGADRVRYLNGQVTNDVRRLAPHEAIQALVLTAKGKLCASVWIWAHDEALIVETEASEGETLSARLERYAISDDVAFELLSPGDNACHAFGPAAATLQGLKINRLGQPGFDLSTAPDGLLEATPAEIETLRIEKGVPLWGRELTEETLPHEAGLETAAVDFKKGCYVGQEVVSRIQSVGRVNRILAGFIGDFSADAPSRSLKLVTKAGDPAGVITSSIFHPTLGQTAALGYRSTRLEDTSFLVQDESGACLGHAECTQFPLVS